MEVLITGANGYLGSFLADQLRYADRVPAAGKKYTYIINCVALTDMQDCAVMPNKAFELNLNSVRRLAERYPSSKIVSFSSYYLYDSPTPSGEDGPINTRHRYCQAKRAMEDFLLNHSQRHLIFRLGKLFAHPLRVNLSRFIDKSIYEGVPTVDRVQFNPCSVWTVLDALRFDVRTNQLHGIFNLANSGIPTHEEVYRFISRQTHHLDPQVVDRIKNDQLDNYGRFAMDTSRIAEYLNLRPWRDDLKGYLLRCYR